MVINETTNAVDTSVTFSFPTWNCSVRAVVMGVVCMLSGVKSISLCLGKSWLGVLLPVCHTFVGLEGVLLYEHAVDYFNSFDSNRVSAAVP